MQFFTLFYKDILLFSYAVLRVLFCFVHVEGVWSFFCFVFLPPIFFFFFLITDFFFFF